MQKKCILKIFFPISEQYFTFLNVAKKKKKIAGAIFHFHMDRCGSVWKLMEKLFAWGAFGLSLEDRVWIPNLSVCQIYANVNPLTSVDVFHSFPGLHWKGNCFLRFSHMDYIKGSHSDDTLLAFPSARGQ